MADPNPSERLAETCGIECLIAWLLYGDGAVCLLCGGRVFYKKEDSGG